MKTSMAYLLVKQVSRSSLRRFGEYAKKRTYREISDLQTFLRDLQDHHLIYTLPRTSSPLTCSFSEKLLSSLSCTFREVAFS